MKKLIVAALIVASLLFAAILAVTYTPDIPRATTYAIRAMGDGNGSGVLIAPNYLLTAAHVASSIKNGTIEYKGFKLPLEVVKIDEKNDIALIKVLGINCPCAPIAEVNALLGTNITTVGFPMHTVIKTQIVTHGVAQGNGHFTSPVGPGNSGGGVFNDKEELVGIVSSIAIAPVGFLQIIPLTHVMQAVEVKIIREFLLKDLGF